MTDVIKKNRPMSVPLLRINYCVSITH